jgi:GNAT superfamily N-acetyltransferase
MQIEIVEQTSLSPRQLSELHAMFGTGQTCGEQEMTTTCFASEYCSQRVCRMQPAQSLATGEGVLVLALKDKVVVGCGKVVPAGQLPSAPIDPNAWCILSLCVHESVRGMHVGKRLVSALVGAVRRARPHCSVCLLVLRGREDEGDPVVKRVMSDRVRRLQRTYSGMGFVQVNQTHQYIVFKHETDTPSYALPGAAVAAVAALLATLLFMHRR